MEGENYGRRACFFICPTDNQLLAVNQTATYAMTWQSFFIDGQPIEQFICEPLTSNFLQLLQNPIKIPSVPPNLATFFGIFDLTDSETIILLNDLLLYLNYVVVYINKFGETVIWDEIPAKEQVPILKSQINDGKVRKASKTTDFKSLAGRFILLNPVIPLSIQVFEQQGLKAPTTWMKQYDLVKCIQCGAICKKPDFEAGKIYITTNPNFKIKGNCPNCGKEIE